VTTGEVQLIAPPRGLVTVQVIDPAGVKPADPVTTTDRVEVPPNEVAVLEIVPIVGTRVEIPTVTWFEETAV
jgi:hypothetical protein